jgi:hypothetical protein
VTKIDGTDFGIAVSNLAGPGTVSVTVSKGAAGDLAGNPIPRPSPGLLSRCSPNPRYKLSGQAPAG